jgi:predicted Rossmann fold nucleotide-binding protein DprA/Smf involved in DNA uptake
MGRRGCWDTDRLCEASQLSVPEVQVALFELQLARRVTAEMGVYSPLA